MFDQKEYSKSWYQKNRQKVIERSKQYRKDHLEERKSWQKEYREQNKLMISQKGKQYYVKNKDMILDKSKKYYEKNREKQCQRRKEYYQQNKDKFVELAKEYRLNKQKIMLEKRIEKFNRACQNYAYKPIPQFQNYLAFQNGKIWSKIKQKFITTKLDQNGYNRMCNLIDQNGVKYSKRYARQIALAFDDRNIDELKEFECHHCNLRCDCDKIQNLVFLPKRIHQNMHDNISRETIISIGAQVKHLRGSAKTNKFVELIQQLFK